MATSLKNPGAPASSPARGVAVTPPTRSWWQKNWHYVTIFVALTVAGVIGAVVIMVVPRIGDVSTSPASPAVAPQSEGVAPAVVAPVASAPAAPVAAVQQPVAPAAPQQVAASASTATTPYGVPHYTDTRKLQGDAGKFVDIQSGKLLPGAPSILTVQGTLWFRGTANIDISWYLTPTLAPGMSMSDWLVTEVVLVSFSEKSPDPKTLAGKTITVRGEIPPSVSGISDINEKLLRLISLDKVEVIGSGP